MKVDQYGTGYLDVRNYSYTGFDVDIAKQVTGQLFGNNDPTFLPVSSGTREPVLASCAIRFFAATYTMLPDREDHFDLAGPYLVTYQGVMVGPHSPRIDNRAQLGGRLVCVVGNGSQAEHVLKTYAPKATPDPLDTYSDCLTALKKGDVDAFSTDLAILYGYLNSPGTAGLHVVTGLYLGDPIYYGLAFRKADHALCLRARDTLKTLINHSTTWGEFLKQDLGNYVADQALYPDPLQPTDDEIQMNSCMTPRQP